MTETPDLMDLLVMALVPRIKDKLLEDIMETLSKNLPKVEADDIQGLDKYIEYAIEEYRNGMKIDADDVEGLGDYIKETLKQATFSIEV